MFWPFRRYSYICGVNQLLMCLRPIKIKNPGLNFRPGIDKPYLVVPCGKCDDCINAKRMDWQCRLYYEHLQATYTGGFSFFFTLTYDEKHVHFIPRYRDSKNRRVLAFSHDDMRLFIKRCRNQLYRSGFPYEVRYFVCSEFGASPDYSYIDDRGNSRFATHRPHYHVLFFLHKMPDTPACDVHFACDRVRQVICDAWPFGSKTFTVAPGMDQSAEPGLVSAAGPLGYVSKYLDKQFASDEYVSQIVEDLAAKYKESKPDKYEQLTDMLSTRHFQSQGLGRGFEKFVPAATLDSGFVPLPLYNAEIGLVEVRNVPLPQYFDIKHNYTYDKATKLYRLHENGLQNKLDYVVNTVVPKLAEDYKYFIDNYEQVFVSHQVDCSHLWMDVHGINFDISDVVSVVNTCCDHLRSDSNFLSNLARVSVAYRGRSVLNNQFQLTNAHYVK